MALPSARRARFAVVAALSFVAGTQGCDFGHPQLVPCDPGDEFCGGGEVIDPPGQTGGTSGSAGRGSQGGTTGSGGGTGGSSVVDAGEGGGGAAGADGGLCDVPCDDDEVCTNDSCDPDIGCDHVPTTGGPCPNGGTCIDGACITEFPEIVTDALPKAVFRIPYAFSFEGAGGTEDGYSWELASGELPPGLSITPGGALSGEPEREGIFGFDVRLTDSAGASARRTFRLDVTRKRWLVYHSDEEVQGEYQIYAVDVARTLDPPSDGVWKWKLTEHPGSYVSPNPYAFSPDGRWLAYLDGVGTLRSLYVRDMTGLDLGFPRRIDDFPTATDVSVTDFDWSPNSQLLAFTVSLDGYPPSVYYTDFRFDPPSGPIDVTAPRGSYSLDWVSNEVLTHSGDYGMNLARRDDNGFFDWEPLGFYGYVRQRWPEQNVAAFDLYNDGCGGTRYLVDFRASEADIFEFEGPIQVSRNLAYLAHWNPPLGYQIYPVWRDTPVAVIPADSIYCAPGAWSNDGRRFVSVGYEDNQLYFVTLDGTATVPVRVPGAHLPVGGITVARPEFSPDDAWLVFSSNLEFFLAPNSSSGIGPSVPIGLGNEAEGFAGFRFAPNSKLLAGSTAPRTTGPGEAFVVDLRSGEPGAPLRFLPRGDEDGAVYGLEWSVDSTRLAYIMRDAPWPAPYRLFVVNPESALGAKGAPVATEISSPLIGCVESTCRFVAAFAFQP